SWPAGHPARAVEGGATAGDEAVDVRVMMQILAPGMEHGDEADIGAEMLGIGGNSAQRLGGCAKQDGVEGCLILKSNRRDLGRYGKNDVEIRYRQQLGLALGKPLGARARPWHFGQCR